MSHPKTAEIRARHLSREQITGRTLYNGHILVDLDWALKELDVLHDEMEACRGPLAPATCTLPDGTPVEMTLLELCKVMGLILAAEKDHIRELEGRKA